MFEILNAPPRLRGDDLDRSDRSSTPELLSTHPRGLSTIHLSKSFTANAGGNFRYRRRDFLKPRQGRRIISSYPALSTAVVRIFNRLLQQQKPTSNRPETDTKATQNRHTNNRKPTCN